MSPELIALSERIRDHLTQQGAQSLGEYGEDNEGGCMYRGPSGTMCAVGCLIKDEFYDRLRMEGKPSSDYVILKAVVESIGVEMSEVLEGLLYRWQAYHDGATTSCGDMLYSKWLEGDDLHSPEAFHDLLTGTL